MHVSPRPLGPVSGFLGQLVLAEAPTVPASFIRGEGTIVLTYEMMFLHGNFHLSASSITVSLRRLKHFDCKEKQALLVGALSFMPP